MILQFSVSNYRCFKERATLSLIASNYDKSTREHDNIVANEKQKIRLLKSAVIYGANASGKSKFIEAMMFMRHYVLSSSKDTIKFEPINTEPFRLNPDTEKAGSEFEVVFLIKNNLYRYGFEVDNKKVIAEWLYHKPVSRERELFYRDYQRILHKSQKLKKIDTLKNENLIRDNALVLSVLAQFNDKTAESILAWFKALKTISGLNEEGYINETMLLSKDNDKKVKILDFLKKADFGINDFKLKKMTLKDLDLDEINKIDVPDDIKNALNGLNTYLQRIINEENQERFSDVITYHKQYDNDGKHIKDVLFSLKEDESSGTRKFFALIGQVISILEDGHVLFIDEIDSKIHPNLMCRLIALFNSKVSNPRNAQLIFNTHDTNLLSAGLFRRDQIWFTEKDNQGATHLYSLADFKTSSVRKNEAFEDNYIRGKYGAIPYLGYFKNVPTTKLSHN